MKGLWKIIIKILRSWVVYALLTGLVILLYLLRIYYPGLFDRENSYFKVYHYKVTEIKSQKKIIKNIDIEFIHPVERLNQNENSQKNIRTNQSIEKKMHITFTDNSQYTIQLEESSKDIGPGLSGKQINNDLVFQKLNTRFPNTTVNSDKDYADAIDLALRLYPGDTLYQDTTNIYGKKLVVKQFQLKNPKTSKLQTYYQYGLTEKIIYSWKPPFFTFRKRYDNTVDTDFFDDYLEKTKDKEESTHYQTNSSGILKTNDDFINIGFLFYSDSFVNLPLSISATGSQFRTTITHTYQKENENGKIDQNQISTTYTEENKEDYINSVLNSQNSDVS